jgi:Transposase zinc-ribbon domain
VDMADTAELTQLKPNEHLSSEICAHLKELQLIARKPGLGTNINSRIAHIDSILGDKEAYATLRGLRWPEMVICPRCHSSRIIRRETPKPLDDKHAFCEFYKCLDCEDIGRESAFDDLTGLEINEVIASIRSWILCWYLSFFCPTKIIAEFTDISLFVLAQMLGTIQNIEENLEPGAVFRTTKQNIESASERNKEHAGAPTFKERLGRHRPTPNK